MEKNKGYSLIETVIVVAIILIFSGTGIIKYRNLKENRALLEAKVKIEDIYGRYAEASFDSGELYKIEIDYRKKQIQIKNNKEEIIEKHKLPEDIRYATPYNGQKEDFVRTTTTRNGNLSDSFTIYLFDYGGLAKYRIAFYIYQKSQLLKINTYYNRSAKDALYENIVNYHTSSAGQNHMGWIKE